MIWRRILIEQRRKVHATRAIITFASVDGSNLWSDPAHHEVLEDSRHFFCRSFMVTSPFPSQKSEREGALRDLVISVSPIEEIEFECECEMRVLTSISEMRKFTDCILCRQMHTRCCSVQNACFSISSGIAWVDKESQRNVKRKLLELLTAVKINIVVK